MPLKTQVEIGNTDGREERGGIRKENIGSKSRRVEQNREQSS